MLLRNGFLSYLHRRTCSYAHEAHSLLSLPQTTGFHSTTAKRLLQTESEMFVSQEKYRILAESRERTGRTSEHEDLQKKE